MSATMVSKKQGNALTEDLSIIATVVGAEESRTANAVKIAPCWGFRARDYPDDGPRA